MLLLAAALAAASPIAAGPPARVGECKWVHGRFNIWNGSSPQEIWVIGTRRLIALSDFDEVAQPEIRRYENGTAEYRDREAEGLYGDFHVCAVQRSRPGHMQHVRLLKTRNLHFHGKPFP